jgi:hypothetical protein
MLEGGTLRAKCRHLPLPPFYAFVLIFTCIFTKNKNIADVIWKSEEAIPINNVIIADFCLLETI